MGLEYRIEGKKLLIFWDLELLKEIDKILILKEIPKLLKSESKKECLEALEELEKKIAIRLSGQLLAKKAYLSHVLEHKLKKRGLSARACQNALLWATTHGFIDDSSGIEKWILQKLKKGYGLNYISYEMQRQKIPLDLLKSKKEFFFKEEQKMKELLLEKYKRQYAKDPHQHAKVFMKLKRRGF